MTDAVAKASNIGHASAEEYLRRLCRRGELVRRGPRGLHCVPQPSGADASSRSRNTAGWSFSWGSRSALGERIRSDAKSFDAIKAAEDRLRPVPWEDRPHIHLKEFVQGAGPEAFLYWDAVFRELGPS